MSGGGEAVNIGAGEAVNNELVPSIHTNAPGNLREPTGIPYGEPGGKLLLREPLTGEGKGQAKAKKKRRKSPPFFLVLRSARSTI